MQDEENKDILDTSSEDEEDDLQHYGTPKHSGRYPWGSGDDPYQHGSGDFLSRVEELRSQNVTYTDPETGKISKDDVAVAKIMGMNSTQFRARYALATNERKMQNHETARKMRESGMSLNAIAKEMGKKNDSSVRSMLNENAQKNRNKAIEKADFLEKQIKEKGYLDVSAGVEKELGVSKEKLGQALVILQDKGYPVYSIGVPQPTNPGQQWRTTILCPKGAQYKDAYSARDNNQIETVMEYHPEEGEHSYKAPERPSYLDSSRVAIRYNEEGGLDKDGLIEIRPGVNDLSLGNSHYAQVRIGVDGTHYLKGMAVYSDDVPEGKDIIFNTNKHLGTDPGDVFKKINDKDPDNPFKSALTAEGQSRYLGEDGKMHLSPINKLREEGEVGTYTKSLPAQFLSKQSQQLIQKQVDLAYSDKVDEFEEIKQISNPTIRRHYLKQFADSCDSSAVDLDAAALPRQSYQVLLPVPTMKDTEVYAPKFRDGESLALVRFPHGGIFEIPVLKVNNKQKDAVKAIGPKALDAVGISKKTADQLSGADFDGDTVIAIPVGGKVKINHEPYLDGLKNFDPKEEYKGHEGMKVMKNTQNEMGRISNLITDMTLHGATDEELTRAIKHSMVVIDAEKHELDYKQSEIDNNIKGLKKKYQSHIGEDGKEHFGASTLLSRAGAETDILRRQGSPRINPETGELEYKESGRTYIDKKTGKIKMSTQKSTQMADTKDARTLISEEHTPQEIIYADYANRLKSLANTARKTLYSTGNLKYQPSAKETYSEEVKSLEKKLDKALLNAPRERKAAIIAGSIVKAKISDNPDISKKEIKKMKEQAMTKAREMVGSSSRDRKIVIGDKEWEAIQAGAISDHKLTQILNNTDIDSLRERATPRTYSTLSESKIARINSMRASGYTISEIADELGVSTSTVSKQVKEQPQTQSNEQTVKEGESQ